MNEKLKRVRGGNPDRSVITTGLIILSSAALGGIAVALWNRKALSTFREFEAIEAREKPAHQLALDLEDEFF